ncbi:non-ribosomal peptide synthetase [Methylobacterium marchantiae]|nr:D-alanine--D-alanyl carrier protein ligase [Methylobacterium marchantiae]
MDLGIAAGLDAEAVDDRIASGSRSPGSIASSVSAIQHRLLDLHRDRPEMPVQNVSIGWRLEGRVESGRLEEAFGIILHRHPVLSSRFAMAPPNDAVAPAAPFHISIIDLTALPECERMTEAEEIARQQADAPLRIDTPPLLQATLLRIGAVTSILLVTAHRLVCDHTSLGLIAGDLALIYDALGQSTVRDDATLFPPPPLGYADVIARWESASDPDVAVGDARYWRDVTAGSVACDLLADRPHPPAPTLQSERIELDLGKDLTTSLQGLCTRLGTTPFVLGLAALKLVLHRRSNATDIAVMTHWANRDEAAFASVVGPFETDLFLRNDLSDDPSFTELLLRIGKNVAKAAAHAAAGSVLPLEPLSPVSFTYRPPTLAEESFGGITISEWLVPSGGTRFELEFVMSDGGAGWCIACDYRTDLFERQSVADLLARLHLAFERVLDDPDLRLSQVDLLTEVERRSLCGDWCASVVPYPAEKGAHGLFTDQARQRPDAIAVTYEGQSLTYWELDAASNRLAHCLRDRGIGPGERVAIFLDRSLDMVVAVMAVLKSGAAYVPLDPSFPSARIAFMIADCGAALILTKQGLQAALPACAVPMLALDSSRDAIAAQPSTSLEIDGPLPNAAAYVIYTSGSTGQPKGVVVGHGSLVNLLWAMRERPGLTENDVLVSVTTLSFDISVLELLLPLVVGARLVVASQATSRDGDALLALLKRSAATVLQATPITWQILLAVGWTGTLRLTMLCGGEPMPRELATRLIATGGDLWNMYGPTETTIWSSADRVVASEGPIPVGTPIANTHFYVLDARGDLSLPGSIGELAIGGDGVALGYHGRPDLTAERFLRDPFRQQPGARLYRTGDLARWRTDGTLELLGRADQQVKIRGYRVEIGEIETALERIPGIAEAAVVALSDSAVEARLVAYLVVEPDCPVPCFSAAEFRSRLSGFLPSYMIPANFVRLESFPRTPNGKLDRKALPFVGPIDPVIGMSDLSEFESRVARIWAETLHVEDIGPSAHFFELGGHSLLAARMFSRLKVELGLRVSFGALFDAPSLREFCRHLTARSEPTGARIVAVQPKGGRPPIIAFHHTSIYNVLSRELGDDQPFYAIRIATSPDGKRRSIDEMAELYLDLVRHVCPEGPCTFLGFCEAGSLAFETARRLGWEGRQVERLILIDSWEPGYLGRLGRTKRLLARSSITTMRSFTRLRFLLTESPASLMVRLGTSRLARHARRMAGRVLDSEAIAHPGDDGDFWRLSDELEVSVRAYQPKPLQRPAMVFRNQYEPSGRFLDGALGWSPWLQAGTPVHEIPSDHLGTFRERGACIMARHLAAAL